MKAGEHYICDWCGKNIILTPVKRCKYKKRLHQFCSKTCYLSFHSRKTIPLYCYNCGKPITSKFDTSKLNRNRGHRFCSNNCWYSWRKKQPHFKQRRLKINYITTKICPQCGEKFNPEFKHKKYCSIKCKNKHDKLHAMKKTNCTQCNKSMLQSKYRMKNHKPFCSKKCLSEYQRVLYKNRHPPNTKCVICGMQIRRPKCRLNVRAPTCSMYCYRIWHFFNMRGVRHPSWNGGNKKYANSFNDYLKKQIIDRDNKHCILCGETDRLRIHHIDYNKMNSSKNNLITLCFDCHNFTNWNKTFWIQLFTYIMAKIVEARKASLIEQKNMESQKTMHHIQTYPVLTLGMSGRLLYQKHAKFHRSGEPLPNDVIALLHNQIPSSTVRP